MDDLGSGKNLYSMSSSVLEVTVKTERLCCLLLQQTWVYGVSWLEIQNWVIHAKSLYDVKFSERLKYHLRLITNTCMVLCKTLLENKMCNI